MTKAITVTAAARNFSDLINRVRYRHEEAILVKGGKPVAQIGPVRRAMTGRELANLLDDHPWLDQAEADSFANDVESGKRKLPPLERKWD